MFTKEEIKQRLRDIEPENINIAKGESLSLAFIIAGCAEFDMRQRSGEDFIQHALEVATNSIQSKNKRIIAILHDVVEDSDWTLEDLREVGFSERIINGVDAVSMRPGEKYFDFIERCSMAGEDAIEIKINDLKHNMDSSRYRHIEISGKHLLKTKAYNVAYHYLVDILKVRADPEADYNAPGRPVFEYMRSRDPYWKTPEVANQLLDAYSSCTERLDIGLSLQNPFRLAKQ